MRKMINVSCVAVALALVAINVVEGYACMCSNFPTACAAYGSADAVFIGYIRETKKWRREEEYGTGQFVYVRVEKAYKGMNDAEVVIRNPRSSCDPTYKKGERWLFYISRDEEDKRFWKVFGCGRSRWIEGADVDLAYLDRLSETKDKTRIAGQIVHYGRSMKPIKNIPRIKIRLIGDKQTQETYTDENGVYEIYGSPPGRYRIEPEIPAGFKFQLALYKGAFNPITGFGASPGEFEVVLYDKNSCAELDFILATIPINVDRVRKGSSAVSGHRSSKN